MIIYLAFQNPYKAPLLGITRPSNMTPELPKMPSTASHSALAYRPEIDGLRGLAVLMVIIFHAGASWLGGGFLGVDIFFVISGYLIAAIAIRETTEKRFLVSHFLERRLRRILPALFILCLLCILPAWLLLPPTDFVDFIESILGNAIAVNNYLFLSEAGYFDSASEMKPLLHTWSLSVEIQFYLSLSLVMIFSRFLTMKRVTIATIALGMASVFGYMYLAKYHTDISFYIYPTRIWEFTAGIFVALLLTQKKFNAAWIAPVGLVALILPIIGLNWFIKNTELARGMVVLATALLIAAAGNKGFANKLLALRLLVGVGVISYSMYLFHNPILSFAKYADIPFTLGFYCISAIAIVALSYASWRYIENPCRNRQHVPRKYFFSICILFFVTSITLYIVTDSTKGFIQQRLNPTQSMMMVTAQRDSRGPKCQTGGKHYRKPSEVCTRFGNKPSWAIFGDSHAGASAYAIASQIHKKTNESSQWLSMRGCPPPDIDKKSSPCENWTTDAVDWLIEDKNIHSVVLIYRLNVYFWGSAVDAYPLKGKGQREEIREATWNNYKKIALRLRDAGKKVVIISPIPEPNKRVTDIIFSEGKNTESLSAVSLPDWERRNAYTMVKLDTLPSDIYIYNPNQLFCDTETCYAVKNLKANYYDHNHLSKQASIHLARAFINDYLKPPSKQVD